MLVYNFLAKSRTDVNFHNKIKFILPYIHINLFDHKTQFMSHLWLHLLSKFMSNVTKTLIYCLSLVFQEIPLMPPSPPAGVQEAGYGGMRATASVLTARFDTVQCQLSDKFCTQARQL